MIDRQVDGIIYATLAARRSPSRAACAASGSCCSTASTRDRPPVGDARRRDGRPGRGPGPAGRRVSTRRSTSSARTRRPGGRRARLRLDGVRQAHGRCGPRRSRAWCRARGRSTPAYDAVSAPGWPGCPAPRADLPQRPGGDGRLPGAGRARAAVSRTTSRSSPSTAPSWRPGCGRGSPRWRCPSPRWVARAVEILLDPGVRRPARRHRCPMTARARWSLRRGRGGPASGLTPPLA